MTPEAGLPAALLVGLAVLLVPGAALLRVVAGLSWWRSLALAPPLSVGFTAVVGLWPAALGGFRPLTWLVAVALLAAGLGWLHRRRPAPVGTQRAGTQQAGTRETDDVEGAGRWDRPVLLGAALGAAAALWVWWPAIWPAAAVPQNYDVNWHGYVTAVVRQSHVGNPYLLVPLDPLTAGPRDFYPVGLHLVMALASTGARSVAPAVNAVQLLLAVLVTPLGVAALARELAPRRAALPVLAPALVAVTASFQAKIIGLPPYAATIALLPAVVALVLVLRRRGWDSRLGAVATLGPQALFAIQPAGAIAAGLVAVVAVLDGVLRAPRAVLLPRSRRRELGRIGVWGVAAALVSAPWAFANAVKASATFGKQRPPYTGVTGAVRDLALMNWNARGPVPAGSTAIAVLVVAAGLAGLGWLAVRAGTTWPLAVYLLFGGLYVVAGGRAGGLRRLLTGPWVGEWYRLMPVAALALALGMAASVAAVSAVAGVAAVERRRAGAVAAVLGVALLAGWADRQVGAARGFVEVSRRPTVVTPAELDAFAWLADHVPAGHRVLDDWQQGTGWMYAADGVVPLVPYVTTGVREPDRIALLGDLARLGTDPSVARRLRGYKVDYVISSRSALPGSVIRLRLPPGDAGLTVVFAEGDVTVYRILLPTP